MGMDGWGWLRWTNGGQIEKNERDIERKEQQDSVAKTKQKTRAVEFEPYCHGPLVVCDLPYAFEFATKKKLITDARHRLTQASGTHRKRARASLPTNQQQQQKKK